MHLRTQGFGAYDLDVDLSPLICLTGPNAAGKSTIANCIRIAALGYVPHLGRTEAATAQLLRDREGSVVLTLPDRRTITRELRTKPKGGYELKTSCSWLDPGAKDEEHRAAAVKVFGSDATAVEEVLDLKQLLVLSGPQRAARIEELIQVAGDPKAHALRLRMLALQRLAGVADDRMPKDLEDFGDLVPLVQGYAKDGNHRGQYAALRDSWADVRTRLGEGLAACQAWVNERKREAALSLQGKRKARDEYGVRLQATPEPDPEEMVRLSARRAEIERSIGAAGERLSEAERKRNEIAKATAGESRAKAEAARAHASRDAVERDLSEAETWRERVAEIDAALSAPAGQVDTSVQDARRTELEAAIAKLEGEAVVVPDELPGTEGLAAEVDRLTARLKAAGESPWAQVRALATEIREESGRSVRGKAISQRADRIREIADANADDPVALTAELEGARNKLTSANHARAKRGEEREAALAELARIKAERDALRDQLREVTAEIHRLRQASDDTARRTSLGLERHDLRQKLDALAARDRDTAAEVARADEALRAATAHRLSLGEEPDADDQDAALSEELQQVTSRLTTLQDVAARHRELRSLLDEIEALEARAVVFTALEDALKRLRGEEVSRQGGPLLEHLNRYLRAAGVTDKGAFIRADKTSCDFGWGSVSVAVMSGAEFACFAAGLVSGILSLREADVRVLLLEAAEQRVEWLAATMRGLSAVSEQLDAAVILTPHAEGLDAPEGWTVRDVRDGYVRERAEARVA
jgi:hypothetical protein